MKRGAAEFLAWERAQPVRYEWFDGAVLARPIGTPRHYALCVRASIALYAALRGRGCAAFSADRQIGAGDGARYLYPDACAVCGRVELQAGTSDVIANPAVVVEVLAHGTEWLDRGLKWRSYQELPSLADYLLVAQAEVRIEHYRREDGDRWSYRAAGAGERLELARGAALAVDAVYAGALALAGE